MNKKRMRFLATLLFMIVLVALAAALIDNIHWRPDIQLSVNGKELAMPSLVWTTFAVAIVLATLFLVGLTLLPLLVLLLPLGVVVAVLVLIAGFLGLLGTLLSALIPLLIVILIWKLATGGVKKDDNA